jgi:hypothetical protein
MPGEFNPAAAEQDANQIFQRNSAWLAPGDHVYNTDLGDHEGAFQQWVHKNKIPFDVSAHVSDYDMRGFWLALQTGDPVAHSAVNKNDGRVHFPDRWKTPYHKSFSAESQWADPSKAPNWNEKDQLVMPDGSVVYDEKAAAMSRMLQQHQSNMQRMQAIKQTPAIAPKQPSNQIISGKSLQKASPDLAGSKGLY